jgi:hypothetical protein
MAADEPQRIPAPAREELIGIARIYFGGPDVTGEAVPAEGFLGEGLVRVGREVELVGGPTALRRLAAVAMEVADDLDAELARRRSGDG